MKVLLLSDLGLERVQSLLALAYRDPKHPFYHDTEVKDLHSQAVSLSDDNAEYLTPNYPMPAIRYQVHYQVGDGDYWCGIYNLHLEETNPMHDDCFVMLWNSRD